MKCSICGMEFGEGANCQNCGVDRVTGLGNYSGYHSSGGINVSQNQEEHSSPKTMVCYACGEIIPTDSKFCPYCSKELYVTCPKCGKTYSSQYPACSECGTNRAKYYKQLEAERELAEKVEKEKKEKLKKQEEQQQLINSAAELRVKLSDNFSGCLIRAIFFYSILIIPTVIIVIKKLNPYALFAWPVCTILVGLLIINTLERRDNELAHERIEKWKQEHPNDPRNKYL